MVYTAIFARLHSIHAVLTFSNGETWPSYNGGKLYHRLLCIYDNMPDDTLGIGSYIKYYTYMISNSKMHLSMPHGSEYHYHHQGSFCACTHPMRECRLLLDRRIRKMIPASCTFPWWTKARWSNMQHHDTYGLFINSLHAKCGIYWLYYVFLTHVKPEF